MAKPMPMFPLGTVLFPHAALPLHLFEDRYRELAETCLRGDGRFGVVLIERGFEVGGGDQRFAVGTVARIVEAARTPDGRYLLATVGTERFRVKNALDDDPVKASYEASARAPIGPLDAQRLLELDDPGERFAELEAMLTDAAEVLELRLAGG